MFNRFKTAIYNVVGSFDPGEGAIGPLGPGVTSSSPAVPGAQRNVGLSSASKEKGLRFPYTRPHFLQLNTEDEIQVSADHAIRPIICPRDINRLPWKTGYAETINAGKSKKNEDQAIVHIGLLTRPMKTDSSNSRTPSTTKEQNLSVRNEPMVNGHADEGESSKPEVQEHTVVLSAQGSGGGITPTTNQDTNQPQDNQGQAGPGDEGSRSINKQGVTLDHPLANPQPPDSPIASADSLPSSGGQSQTVTSVSLPYYMFGVFDGHAGWGAAVAAANQLHHIIHEKLCDVIDVLLPDPNEDKSSKPQSPLWAPEKEISIDNVVTGALETAFWQMDNVIAEDRLKFQLLGGCTACVGLFIHGKVFVANAGDSRGVIALDNKPVPMSYDFTPETESQRIRKLGAMHPELLGGEYTHLDYIQRPLRRDLGKRIMYRDHYMSGWTYKTLTPGDLKYPLVCGEGKRSRVLATIGVTRGFGDHDLKAQYSSIPIKPFLTPEPEVKIFDVESHELSDGDVLLLATDGLWDITTNEKAVSVVGKSLSHFPMEDQDKHKYRYTSAAQDLVMSARGKLKDRNWRTSDDKHATIDDISVFVIPLKPYKQKHQEWTLKYKASNGASQNPPCATVNTVGAQSLVNIFTPAEPTETIDSAPSTQVERVRESGPLNAVQVMDTATALPQDTASDPVSTDLKPQEDYFTEDVALGAQTAGLVLGEDPSP